MADQVEELLRATMVRQYETGPAVNGDELLQNARTAHRRKVGAIAVLAAAVAVVAAVAVPLLAFHAGGSRSPAPPAISPAPTPAGKTDVNGQIAKVTGRWSTSGVSALTATSGHAFALESGLDSRAPLPLTRIGDDGVHRARLTGATVDVGPSLLASNSTAVFAASQRPHTSQAASDRIWRIDPSTLKVTATRTLPGLPFSMTATDRYLYIGSANAILALDPVTLTTLGNYTTFTRRSDSTSVFSLAAGSQQVYAAYGDALSAQLLLLSPTLRLLGATPLPAGQGARLVGGDCTTWLITPTGTMRSISGGELGPDIRLPGGTVIDAAATCDGADAITQPATGALLVHIDQAGHVSASQPLPADTAGRAAVDLQPGTLWVAADTAERLVLQPSPQSTAAANAAAAAAAAAAARAKPCTLSDLQLDYVGGGMGAGNAFGTITMRNITAADCRLDRPVDVAGLDGSGATLRLRRTLTSQPANPPLLLTAHTPAVPRGSEPPAGYSIAAVIITGEYRDGPDHNGTCAASHEVTPSAWLVTLGTNSLKIRNFDQAGQVHSLLACLGNFSIERQTTL